VTPTSTPAQAIRAQQAVIGGAIVPATLVVRDGVITAIGDLGLDTGDADVLTVDPTHVLLPGLVDTHVHVNEPGRTEWEGFVTATTAAAFGGVTTVLDMPLNSLPPTTTAAALDLKRATADGKCRVDVGFWGGVVPGNLGDLAGLHEAGVFGFKAFLQDSGVPEFPPVDALGLTSAMRELADLGSLLLVHAEDPTVLAAAPAAAGRHYPAFVASRPVRAETTAIATVIEAAAATGCRAHIVHLSSGAGAQLVRQAKESGVQISAETCPHYLTLNAEGVPDGAPQYKCCPPIRGRDDQDALWAALIDGTIDIVVSDHSPSTPDLKLLDSGDVAAAWGGISSLELGLRLMWTEATRRGIGLERVSEWMSTGPARLVGLPHKGSLTVGAHADMLVFDPGASSVVDVGQLHHRHPVSPYDRLELTGSVGSVWLRGALIDPGSAAGRFLTPARTTDPHSDSQRPGASS
jgi:allantoinase